MVEKTELYVNVLLHNLLKNPKSFPKDVLIAEVTVEKFLSENRAQGAYEAWKKFLKEDIAMRGKNTIFEEPLGSSNEFCALSKGNMYVKYIIRGGPFVFDINGRWKALHPPQLKMIFGSLQLKTLPEEEALKIALDDLEVKKWVVAQRKWWVDYKLGKFNRNFTFSFMSEKGKGILVTVDKEKKTVHHIAKLEVKV